MFLVCKATAVKFPISHPHLPHYNPNLITQYKLVSIFSHRLFLFGFAKYRLIGAKDKDENIKMTKKICFPDKKNNIFQRRILSFFFSELI